MDLRLGTPPGWVHKTTDVAVRHFAGDGETASYMGARAAEAALAAAELRLADIDCLVCASGTKEQVLPGTASFIQQVLGDELSGVPAFDLDATCLSFLTGLDVMSYLVEAGRYRHVLLVSTEIASVGLNWNVKESAALFGDGAAAVVIGPSEREDESRIVGAAMRTYGKGARLSEIRGGGSHLHAREHNATTEADFLFRMNGQALFKMASKLLPGFVDDLLAQTGTRMADFQAVIPHQGSAMAMRLIRKKLGISEEQLVYIAPNYGNTIAASLPMGLHEAIRHGKVRRGDQVLLLGTAAGLSLGGMILVY
jgi:3-oxoacyl-[acyl-carrier-protein] synthase-3